MKKRLLICVMNFLSILFLLAVSISHADGFSSAGIRCLDGQMRGLGIYVPPQYRPEKPAPLFVWLHGGVNRPEKNRGIAAVSFFTKEAERSGILCAAPSGEKGATWFDFVGFDNIGQSLSYMLTHFSVDTNRIFVGGSSDGATACYLLAAKQVKFPIRGFVVCSGFPGVLEQLGMPFDAGAYKAYAWYVIHTGKDQLYPLPIVREYVSDIKKGGADVVFREYPLLPHGLEYAEEEKPLILKWMMGANGGKGKIKKETAVQHPHADHRLGGIPLSGEGEGVLKSPPAEDSGGR